MISRAASWHGLAQLKRLTRIRFAAGCLWLLLAALAPVQATPAGKAEHVVMMVWDGLRPDSVSAELTPNLWAMSQRGVFFKNHHPVYISSTEVNGTALITGAHPEHSGIIANREYRPQINWTEPFATESLDAVRRGDWITGGHYIAVPTLTETLQGAGFRTVVAGTKPVALLLDRAWDRATPAAQQSVDLNKGRTVPVAALAGLEHACGGDAFPKSVRHPNRRQDAWTTRALIDGMWADGLPKFSVLWMSDPDYSQHSSGPGSWTARRALRSADDNLGQVLRAIEAKGVRNKTDVMVVSDHGFSTVEKGVNIVDLLKKAKFQAVKKFDDAVPGQILVVGLGGSTTFYVAGHDTNIIRNLVAFLQTQDFTGVVFTQNPLPGTFPLSTAKVHSLQAPDVLISMRWNAGIFRDGAPGLLITDGGTRGKGSHGSLSPYDMHNTLIAAGPDFKTGWVNETPSGNIDVAPTVLAILGIPQAHAMDGRVLSEAFAHSPAPAPEVRRQTLEATANNSGQVWRQYLKISTVGQAVYFDEGNGR